MNPLRGFTETQPCRSALPGFGEDVAQGLWRRSERRGDARNVVGDARNVIGDVRNADHEGVITGKRVASPNAANQARSDSK